MRIGAGGYVVALLEGHGGARGGLRAGPRQRECVGSQRLVPVLVHVVPGAVRVLDASVIAQLRHHEDVAVVVAVCLSVDKTSLMKSNFLGSETLILMFIKTGRTIASKKCYNFI